jgi:predicted metal-dependent peptidase
MTPETIALAVMTSVAVGSLILNAAQGRFNALQGRAKSERDQKDIEIKGRAQDNADDVQVLSVAKVNIEMLEKQNELLANQLALNTAQGEQREADWRKREDEWRREKKNFETRIGSLEASYKTLVTQVQELGVCTRFETCKDYAPPGRRDTHTKIGGTE